MTSPTLRTILERARAEAQAEMISRFRERLLAQPDLTLAAYSLSADEAAGFRSLVAQRLAQLEIDLSASDSQ